MITEKLDKIIGKTFLYKGKKILIEKWRKVNSAYVIITSARVYNFYESEIENFINELTNPQNKMEANSQLAVESTTNLTKVLYDTILKVQNNKEYINQANAICNVVSQMINIKKLELQMSSKK